MTLARRRKAPVRFVDQVVAANPRLVLVAPGAPGPQRDGLALILRALPPRRLRGVAVGDGAVVSLAAGPGVVGSYLIHLDRPSPVDHMVATHKLFEHARPSRRKHIS